MPGMTLRTTCISLICLALTGCGDSEDVAPYGAGDPNAFSVITAQDRGPYMAYTHSLVVDLDENLIDGSYQAVVEACSSSENFSCEILNSSLNQGQYRTAYITMRVEPTGVVPIVTVASKHGTITNRQTNAEDLEDTIVDLDIRISMLTTTRGKLIELEERESNDIDSLIKITTELTKIQSELEKLTGQSAYQRRRVETDVLSIQFVAQQSRSFWKPISVSLLDFGYTLSDGMGDTISAIAYLLPWSILILVVAYMLRILWRKSRRK